LIHGKRTNSLMATRNRAAQQFEQFLAEKDIK
jgi:hypothetical protein